jgi:hypothetical protein
MAGRYVHPDATAAPDQALTLVGVRREYLGPCWDDFRTALPNSSLALLRLPASLGNASPSLRI